MFALVLGDPTSKVLLAGDKKETSSGSDGAGTEKEEKENDRSCLSILGEVLTSVEGVATPVTSSSKEKTARLLPGSSLELLFCLVRRLMPEGVIARVTGLLDCNRRWRWSRAVAETESDIFFS